jgi:hypothetical protein
MKKCYCAFLIVIYVLFTANVNAQQTYFPSANIAWKNIKTDFGAVGDGVTDDTQAFNTALQTYAAQYNSRVSVFVPDGTYLVSDKIRGLYGFFDCCQILRGESRAGTIIKVKDNSPNFQNNTTPTPLFKTRGGNQAFGNYFMNLTINTGLNNPGIVAIDYVTNNIGSIKDVSIISPDGSGYCGISMEQNWPGPGLLKNVFIDGYQYGIRVATCEYSMTFEDITLNNQTIAGLKNSCNTLAIRKLTSYNTVKAIDNSGRITIVDSDLLGGAAANTAIVSTGGQLFARNIQTSGYGTSINNSYSNNPVINDVITSNSIDEYKNSKGNYSTFANDGKSLNLAIEETPVFVNNTPADWADVTTYGAQPTNPQFVFVDATAGVQGALNSGKKAVYLGKIGDNGTGYCIYSDITVPASVEMITGFNLSQFIFFNNAKLIIQCQ